MKAHETATINALLRNFLWRRDDFFGATKAERLAAALEWSSEQSDHELLLRRGIGPKGLAYIRSLKERASKEPVLCPVCGEKRL